MKSKNKLSPRDQLEWLWANCQIRYWTPEGSLPRRVLEHDVDEGSDARAKIEAETQRKNDVDNLRITIKALERQGRPQELFVARRYLRKMKLIPFAIVAALVGCADPISNNIPTHVNPYGLRTNAMRLEGLRVANYTQTSRTLPPMPSLVVASTTNAVACTTAPGGYNLCAVELRGVHPIASIVITGRLTWTAMGNCRVIVSDNGTNWREFAFCSTMPSAGHLAMEHSIQTPTNRFAKVVSP